jgi:hypothetical protein
MYEINNEDVKLKKIHEKLLLNKFRGLQENQSNGNLFVYEIKLVDLYKAVPDSLKSTFLEVDVLDENEGSFKINIGICTIRDLKDKHCFGLMTGVVSFSLIVNDANFNNFDELYLVGLKLMKAAEAVQD